MTEDDIKILSVKIFEELKSIFPSKTNPTMEFNFESTGTKSSPSFQTTITGVAAHNAWNEPKDALPHYHRETFATLVIDSEGYTLINGRVDKRSTQLVEIISGLCTKHGIKAKK